MPLEDYTTYTEVDDKAIRALGEIGDTQAIPHIIKSLKKDKHKATLIKIARSLGKISDPQAVPYLIKLLEAGVKEGRISEETSHFIRSVIEQ